LLEKYFVRMACEASLEGFCQKYWRLLRWWGSPSALLSFALKFWTQSQDFDVVTDT
jgi:hypothetical protein